MVNNSVTQTTPNFVAINISNSVELPGSSSNVGFLTNQKGEVINPNSIKIGEIAYFVVYKSGNSSKEIKLTQTPIIQLVPFGTLEVRKIKLTQNSKIGKFAISFIELVFKFLPNLDKRPVKAEKGVTCSWKVLTYLVGECEGRTILTTINCFCPLTKDPDKFFEFTISVLSKE